MKYNTLFYIFFLFFISTLAETNRPPFDLPEAEAELVSGYNVEYSAMSFGFFFLGEYVAIWTVCSLNVILFWGGSSIISHYQSIFIYSLKVIGFVIVFIWVRGSLPRYRYDQLMRLGWKILLPISLGFVILYAGIYYEFLFLCLEKKTALGSITNSSSFIIYKELVLLQRGLITIGFDEYIYFFKLFLTLCSIDPSTEKMALTESDCSKIHSIVFNDFVSIFKEILEPETEKEKW